MFAKLLRVFSAATLLSVLVATSVWADTLPLTTFQSPLVATAGQGAGSVQGSTTGANQGYLDAQVTVDVNQTAPNTTFNVIRKLDPTIDGTCSGVSTVSLGQLTTSDGGAASTHFDVDRTTQLSGSTFEIQFETKSLDGSIDLVSQCLPIEVR